MQILEIKTKCILISNEPQKFKLDITRSGTIKDIKTI